MAIVEFFRSLRERVFLEQERARVLRASAAKSLTQNSAQVIRITKLFRCMGV